MNASSASFLQKALTAIGACCLLALPSCRLAAQQPTPMELSRAARPWEFISSTGKRAALFGKENGQLEAWVYPLKILRNFELRFRVDGHIIPAASLARTVTVRPESSTITYTWDTFTVRETLFVPFDAAGAIIRLDIDTAEPLDVTAAFARDFQLEWPAAIADSDMDWMPALDAFYLSAQQQKYAAFVGSPSAIDHHQEYSTNYAANAESSLDLGTTKKGAETKYVVMAASTEGRAPAEALYRQLAASYDALLEESAKYYRDYLQRTVDLDLPDKTLEQAYDWARVAVLQGVVDNPFLGTGLIAGYSTSGPDERPGYAWFFGRDALWTSLALNATGDFATTRTALAFLAKYQRADGKITHEIAQTASFVPWFTELPYAYAAADATPLYIIAADDYVRRSGDTAFATEKWDSLWRAYQFLRSTYDAQGFPRNATVGHGWVEGGPLLPVESELYQSALGTEALRALADLAQSTGKNDIAASMSHEFTAKQSQLNTAFWMPDRHRYAFALDGKNQPVDTASVLSTVPMWFQLLDADKANQMISALAAPAHQTDWGMRILSSGDPRYDPGGYHFGTVWPLFTGWASVGEYRYHRPFPAYENLRANALLTFDGSLGHVTEVLSGNYNQGLATASPQQVWSSAMVTSPLLTGMLGLDSDAVGHRIRFAPHVPADWKSFGVDHLSCGPGTSVSLRYTRTEDALTLATQNTGGRCEVEFSPALSLRAHVLSAQFDGKAIPFHIDANANDQHVTVRLAVSNLSATLVIRVHGDFGFAEATALPALGEGSRGLRLLSESWSADRNALTLKVAGHPGTQYELSLPEGSEVTAVDGARLEKAASGHTVVIDMPVSPGSDSFENEVVLHFAGKATHPKER